MKPGKNDTRYQILITGIELEELQLFTGDMCEAFGLDDKIEKYKGTRPITFYSWDLDCLDCVMDMAIDDEEAYPGKSGPEYEAIRNLRQRLLDLRKDEAGGPAR